LLRHKPIALGADDEPVCEFEWDAEESSFRALVEPHLLEQIVNTGDGERWRKQVEVFVGRGICYKDVLHGAYQPLLYQEYERSAHSPEIMLIERFVVRSDEERFDRHTSLQ